MVDSIGHAHAVGGGGDPRRLPSTASPGGRLRLGRLHARAGRSCSSSSAASTSVFAPAYFEDTDLCFKLHERGLKTVFEPRSRVVHIRHGSGTSEARAS